MLNETPRRIPTIGFVSLGCAKALVDSERVITDSGAKAIRSSITTGIRIS